MTIERCPLCGWRLFDIEWCDKTTIEIKCPNCRKIVTIVKVAS